MNEKLLNMTARVSWYRAIYDNGHFVDFETDTHIIVEKADLEKYRCKSCHQIFSIMQDVKTEGTQIMWCPFCKSYQLKYLSEGKKNGL